jgi:8-oxo-dGTP pyrophosphatase MutT (NUDIX family)
MSATRMVVDLVPQLARAIEARARRMLNTEGKTRAAVLVPLVPVDDGVHLLFTRRAATLPSHQGQVAFPGGTHDTSRDPSVVATALREAHEEIGLRPEDVRVLGVLDDIETMTSRFLITPVVGVTPYPYTWAPCPREVDHIFTVRLDDLLAPDAARRETWDFGGNPVPIDHFPVAGQVIWGATYRITRNLLDIVVKELR